MSLDSVFFVFNYEPGKIKIQIAMNGEPWRYIYTDYDCVNSPSFWQDLEARAQTEPFDPREQGLYRCPVCGSTRNTFLRPFNRRFFCGFCGAHLEKIVGELIVRAKID